MHREMLFLSWKTLLMIQNIGMCFQFYAWFSDDVEADDNESHAARAWLDMGNPRESRFG